MDVLEIGLTHGKKSIVERLVEGEGEVQGRPFQDITEIADAEVDL